MMNRILSPNRSGSSSRLLNSAAALLLTAGSGLFFTACSGSGGGGGGGQMFVQTCSLGCSNAGNGLQVSCAVSEIFQNQELAVLFSEPVDPMSLSSSSFRILDPVNSTVPFGSFLVDPTNPNRVLFRPALTIDPISGQPSFGLNPTTTYQITIPGVEQNDPPPYIRSMSGRPNQTRLFCTVSTGIDLVDLVPGPPVFSATLTTLDGMGAQVPDQPADGAVNVDVNSTIRFVFNDVMNAATLVDSASGTSSFIRIESDADGNLATEDRSPVGGTFVADIDELFLRTTVVFTPSTGFPGSSGGPDALKIAVTLLPGIQDISGNNLANAGLISFTPQIIVFEPLDLPVAGGEDFSTNVFEDNNRSGAEWGGGILSLADTSGGSGRLGDLLIGPGQTVTLDTDSQVFPLGPQFADGNNFAGQDDQLITNAVPVVDYDPLNRNTWPTATVTNGVFEFANLRVEQNGRLILRGSNPARIIVRGEAFVGGVIDASGASPGQHDSSLVYGQAGGLGGPNAGAGGTGATRFDAAAGVPGPGFFNLVCKGALGGTALDCPPPVMGMDTGGLCPAMQFCTPSPFDSGPQMLIGRGGQGIAVAPAGGIGSGRGGINWPPVFPMTARIATVDFGDGGFNRLETPPPSPPGLTLVNGCTSLKVGAGGGGASYGRSGTASDPHTLTAIFDDNNDDVPDSPVPTEALLDQAGDSNVPPPTPPADQAAIGINATVMQLNPAQGNLRGGAGGGGAGAGLFGVRAPGMPLDFNGNPVPCEPTVGSTVIEHFLDQSGAAGGGGGGAIQIFGGRSLVVGGRIDASGGNGGGARLADDLFTGSAAPGGGGSGGAIKLQSPLINIAGSVDVSGGDGGAGVTDSVGGTGGGGLVRMEATAGTLVQAEEAQNVLPFDPMNPTSSDILSLGTLGSQNARPESFSGSTSCWLRPPGNYSRLNFPADDFTDPNNPVLSWNMTLRIDNQPGAGTNLLEVPYRGPNGIMMNSFEDELGNMLNVALPSGMGSPVAIRFQGARLTGSTNDLCDLDLNGLISDIQQNSLTPWVSHPEELNMFDPRPDIVRYTVIFDRNLAPGVLELVQGVTNVTIVAERE